MRFHSPIDPAFAVIAITFSILAGCGFCQSKGTKSDDGIGLLNRNPLRAHLQGHYLGYRGIDSMTMSLQVDSGKVSGVMRVGSAKPGHLQGSKVTLIKQSKIGPQTFESYAWVYAVNACENDTAESALAPYRWGHCFHREGEAKPAHLRWGKATLELMWHANGAALTVLGFPDSGTIAEVYRAQGSKSP